MSTPRNRCTRCEEFLHPAREVWLSYDQRTGTYTDQDIPPEHDQGGFVFGKACSLRALAEHRDANLQRKSIAAFAARAVRK